MHAAKVVRFVCDMYPEVDAHNMACARRPIQTLREVLAMGLGVALMFAMLLIE